MKLGLYEFILTFLQSPDLTEDFILSTINFFAYCGKYALQFFLAQPLNAERLFRSYHQASTCTPKVLPLLAVPKVPPAMPAARAASFHFA